MNFSSKNYKSYLDPVTPNYKSPSDRHLQLYNGVTIDESTSTQENPFNSQHSLDDNDASSSQYDTSARSNIRDLPSHSAAVDAGLYPQRYPLDGATMGDSTADRNSGSTLPRNRGVALAHQAHIEYDTALSPMEVDAKRLNGFHGYSNQDNYANYAPHHGAARGGGGGGHPDMEGSPRSSVNSEHSYNHGELTSFKVGSTTQLVPSSHNIPQQQKSSKGSLSKGSGNISFVDNSPSNSMYSSLTSQVKYLFKKMYALNIVTNFAFKQVITHIYQLSYKARLTIYVFFQLKFWYFENDTTTIIQECVMCFELHYQCTNYYFQFK